MIERLKIAWRILTRGDGLYEPELEREDGWTDWIHPQSPYSMECCDCGLVHELEFYIGPSGGVVPKNSFNEGESQARVIWFKARRA